VDRRSRGDVLTAGTGRGPDGLGELVRSLAPQVLGGLLRRGEEFAAAEDAVQDAVVDALRVWPQHPPRDPRAWLSAVATRRLVDARRSESARRAREQSTACAQTLGPTEHGDDTLLLLFLCCHPDLSPASQIALTLRAVGGLTTGEIADAFFVPEATMAQRIARAKRTVRDRSFREPGDLAVVLRVLSLIHHTGHGRRDDLAAEAIRLTRQLTFATPEPEARGLLALMLLQDAWVPARTDDAGRLVTLDEQDRSRWNTAQIAEAVAILQGAIAEGRPGRHQIQAAIAALHADAATSAETDWPQILGWYDDLVALSDDPDHDDPAAVLSRAVAVGHVDGAGAGLAETERVRASLGDRDQWHAVRAYLHELGGEPAAAAAEYAAAADRATERTVKDHLVRRAARARARIEQSG
jgi:RNA polymerase sigma factor (sigma-70 family)